MKSLHLVVLLLISLCTASFGQLGTPKSEVPPAAPESVALSEAQKSFDQLKTLAGNWTGTAAMGQGSETNSAPVRVSLRVTSGGAALMHEMVPEGRPNDPTNGDDDPLTMLYVDGDRLLLTHYCDSGKNRPHMVGKLSPDGKTVEFDFLDVSGGTKDGYMQHALFTLIDSSHHTEDWTYMMPGKKASHAHIDLHRSGVSGLSAPR